MDKIATNNFIVCLRKDVKAAKAMVAGNLTRKIVQLKEELEKTDHEVQRAKIEAKIERIHSEIKMLKTIDNYLICKDAMLQVDAKYWNNKIGDSKAQPEECLKARVICKARVQKQIQNFRSQHADCDEWLNEYFEFREKKKELTSTNHKRHKRKQSSVYDKLKLDKSRS